MAYRDPYNNQPYSSQPYTSAQNYHYTQPAQQETVDHNPYEGQPQYATYDEQPYAEHTRPGYEGPAYDGPAYGAQGDDKGLGAARQSMGAPPKSTGMLRIWRHDMKGKVWTRGGGLRSCCRFFCCSIMTFIFLVLAIILPLALYVRPPDITFNGINTPSSGNVIQVVGTDSFVFNLDFNIGVRNPNFFGVEFPQISLQLIYPGYTFVIGNGSVSDVNFQSDTNTDFVFPFSFNYTTSADPNLAILKDIATKCGVIGGVQSNINLNFIVNLKLKLLSFTISLPAISGTEGIPCPVSAQTIEDELGPLIGQVLGGSSNASLAALI